MGAEANLLEAQIGTELALNGDLDDLFASLEISERNNIHAFIEKHSAQGDTEQHRQRAYS
jgi:hypothetical protein